MSPLAGGDAAERPGFIFPETHDVGLSHPALRRRGIDEVVVRAGVTGVRTANPPKVKRGSGPIAGATVACLWNPIGITIELAKLRDVPDRENAE